MIRLVLMGLGTFLLSLGGTTGALVMKGRSSAPAIADAAAHGDSTGAAPDAHGPAAHDSAGAPVASRTAPPSADSARAPAPAGTPTSEAAPAQVRPGTHAGAAAGPPGGDSALTAQPLPALKVSAPDGSYRQLARIFANMKTTDAVKVMGFMSDDEVQGVLEQLGVRQAAALLAAFPKERAAVLSRRLLHAAGPETAAR